MTAVDHDPAPTADRSARVGWRPAHPYAEKFPMLPADELADLADSILNHGLRQPIVITVDGSILDGRNRYAACELAGVKPEVVVYEGDDLAQFVIDANTHRRNQSPGARAMSTALVLAEDGRRRNGRWAWGAVENSQDLASSRGEAEALRRAGVVLDHAPDLAEQVVSDGLSLNAAYTEACERRDAAQAAEDAARDAADDEPDTPTRDGDLPAAPRVSSDLFQTVTSDLSVGAYLDDGEMPPDSVLVPVYAAATEHDVLPHAGDAARLDLLKGHVRAEADRRKRRQRSGRPPAAPRPTTPKPLTDEEQEAADLAEADRRAARAIERVVENWPYLRSVHKGKRRDNVLAHLGTPTLEALAEIESELR